MGIVSKARELSLSRVDSLRMILAGGFTSGREIRRFRTEAEAAANLDYLVPPTTRPWLSGPAFDPCSTGCQPNSGDFLYLGAARVGVIDRSNPGSLDLGVGGPTHPGSLFAA
jgi:hypothetical protein